MTKISENKVDFLRKEFDRVSEDETFALYVKGCSESDPNFFAWLFDEEFDVSLSEEQREAFNELLKEIEEENLPA